jgi:hypothetical protein
MMTFRFKKPGSREELLELAMIVNSAIKWSRRRGWEYLKDINLDEEAEQWNRSVYAMDKFFLNILEGSYYPWDLAKRLRFGS